MILRWFLYAVILFLLTIPLKANAYSENFDNGVESDWDQLTGCWNTIDGELNDACPGASIWKSLNNNAHTYFEFEYTHVSGSGFTPYYYFQNKDHQVGTTYGRGFGFTASTNAFTCYGFTCSAFTLITGDKYKITAYIHDSSTKIDVKIYNQSAGGDLVFQQLNIAFTPVISNGIYLQGFHGYNDSRVDNIYSDVGIKPPTGGYNITAEVINCNQVRLNYITSGSGYVFLFAGNETLFGKYVEGSDSYDYFNTLLSSKSNLSARLYDIDYNLLASYNFSMDTCDDVTPIPTYPQYNQSDGYNPGLNNTNGWNETINLTNQSIGNLTEIGNNISGQISNYNYTAHKNIFMLILPAVFNTFPVKVWLLIILKLLLMLVLMVFKR